MKKLFFILLFPFLANAQSASDVIAKYVTATGGQAAIDSVVDFKYTRSYVANATTDYNEVVVLLGSKNQFSREKTIMKKSFFYVLNGKSGFLKIPTNSLDTKVVYDTQDLKGTHLQELENEVEDGLLPFINYQEKGYKVVGNVGTETVNGKATSKIKLERPGTVREYFFDNTTGLLAKETWTVSNVTYTLEHSKYEETAAKIKLPTVSVYYSSRDKKKNNVNTKWFFDKPGDSVSFTK